MAHCTDGCFCRKLVGLAGLLLLLLLGADLVQAAAAADTASHGPQDPDGENAQLERAYEAFNQLSSCTARRNVNAVLESNKIFDANWDAETGEMHESVRGVLEKDPQALFFMIKRVFASGLTYSLTEAAYLGCLAKFLRREGLQKYAQILEQHELRTGSDADMKQLLASLFMAIGFKDGRLIVSPHVNEVTVERMQAPIKRLLTGEKQKAALQAVREYNESLVKLTRQVEAVGRLINEHFDDERSEL